MTPFARMAGPLSLLLALAGTAAAQTPSGPAPPPESAAARQARCAVWQRELAFAQSVRDHDVAAFSDIVHENAVFGVGSQPTRGRAAITESWTRIIDGSALELQWYPDTVSVGGDGRTAYSSGPALYRSKKDGSYRLGRFGSVWQIDSDGQWRTIFDDGIQPVPADEAAVKAFNAGRRTECPAA